MLLLLLLLLIIPSTLYPMSLLERGFCRSRLAGERAGAGMKILAEQMLSPASRLLQSSCIHPPTPF
jgi:hypothetical protein